MGFLFWFALVFGVLWFCFSVWINVRIAKDPELGVPTVILVGPHARMFNVMVPPNAPRSIWLHEYVHLYGGHAILVSLAYSFGLPTFLYLGYGFFSAFGLSILLNLAVGLFIELVADGATMLYYGPREWAHGLRWAMERYHIPLYRLWSTPHKYLYLVF